MSAIYLFDVASKRSQWLSLRQATISTNIANANTPGYGARDVQPFESVLQSSSLDMAATSAGHVSQAPDRLGNIEESQRSDAWHVSNSGNSVKLEQEMEKAGEVQNAFALNNGVMKAFHRMLLSATKG
jgi:flagellar basal-body rod protein FlgB